MLLSALPVPLFGYFDSFKTDSRIHSKALKAFDSAEGALDSYETCFAPFRCKTEMRWRISIFDKTK